MAAKTFNPAGSSDNWSTPGAWGGSIPVSGDTCTISANKTCNFDVDQSAMAAGLAGLLINGILQCSTTAGAYVLKMDGTAGHNITFGASGQLLAGSAGTPLPANVTFTINLNGASAINPASQTSALIALYCQQPTHKYCKLTQANNAADTVLHVDTDLTGEAPWGIASARVDIVNINKAQDMESRLISSKTSTTITLTAGLTNAKITGAYVVLTHRNIRITGYTGATAAVQNAMDPVFQCEASGLTVAYNGCIRPTCSGSISVTTSGMTSNFAGTVSGTVTGGTGACVTSCANMILSGFFGGCATGPNVDMTCWLTSASIVAGCGGGVFECMAFRVDGLIIGCNNGIQYGSGIIGPSAVFTGNSVDVFLARGGDWVGYGITFTGAGDVNSYREDMAQINRVVIWDYAGVVGALRAWTGGGRIVDGVAQLPGDSRIAKSFNHIFEASWAPGTPCPCWLDYEVRLHVGVNSFLVFMRKDTNSMTVTPFAQLLTPGADPRFGGAAFATVTMVDNTNTWQTLIVSYTSTVEQNAILRVSGTNASGNLWHAMVQIPNGFSRSDSI